jgi:hypothetical protein
MIQCIDIYSRLMIATITFVVPIIITLLSTFTAGEKRRNELATLTSEQISKSAAEEVQSNPEKIRETIQKTSEEYKRIDKITKRELNLLNPLRQFWNIFSAMAFSLLTLLFYYLIINHSWGINNHKLSIRVIVISGLSYSLALFFIIRIIYTISKTRKIIENN